MFTIDLPTQIDAVRRALATHGVLPTLALLNDRVPHRFTGIYQLRGEAMHAAAVFDRTGPSRSWLRAIALRKSLCQHTFEQGEFHVRSVATDRRLSGHPYDGLVQSYYGLPLVRSDGAPYGTFIHFDLAEREVAPDEAAFLKQVAPMFLPYLT